MNETIMFVDSDFKDSEIHIFNLNSKEAYYRRFENAEVGSIVPIISAYYGVKKIVIEANGIGKAVASKISHSIKQSGLKVEVIPIYCKSIRYESIKS